ncbi:hypothetical protein [Streptomyces sp. R08]|uniref:Secreted protein n=1 Tax=Streptomyces sp. R08 TaxID=3238624 RepID=A0AB39MR78_9ACTN
MTEQANARGGGNQLRRVAAGGMTAAALGAFIVFEDEAGFSKMPPRARTWGRRGYTPVVRVLRDYPAMGVPHYLIVGSRDGTAVHHWAPTRRTGEPVYDNRQHYTFGDTVTVTGWKIDTTALPRYSADAGW